MGKGLFRFALYFRTGEIFWKFQNSRQEVEHFINELTFMKSLILFILEISEKCVAKTTGSILYSALVNGLNL